MSEVPLWFKSRLLRDSSQILLGIGAVSYCQGLNTEIYIGESDILGGRAAK